MEGAIFPSRPTFPVQQPTSSTHYPLPPYSPSPPSLAIDSLLQHLLRISSSTSSSLIPIESPQSASSAQYRSHSVPPLPDDDGSLEFLSPKCKFMLNLTLEQPLSDLNSFFESVRSDLLGVDLFRLLKGLDLSGDWRKAVSLFEWVVLNYDFEEKNKVETVLDSEVIELMARVPGMESEHTVAHKLFDLIPLEDFSLHVRVFTTIIHSYSQAGLLATTTCESHESCILVTSNMLSWQCGKIKSPNS